MYDIIIIGAGPAGLTAAINTAHRGLKTLVIEQYDKPGGQPLIFYPDKIIKDHPGFPIGVLAKEFARRVEMQAINAGAEIKCNEEALKINKIDDNLLEVKTNNGLYKSKRVIICTGMLNIPRKLPILENYKGKGIYYKIENLNEFKGKKVTVIGGGDNAFDSAIQIKEIASNVNILIKHAYAKAKEITVEEAESKGIKIYYNTELTSIINYPNSKKIKKIKILDTKTKLTSELSTDMIFSSIGFSTVYKFLKDNNIELNNDGTVKTNDNYETTDNYETNIKGVFAAGDLNGEAKLIAVASARGIQAAIQTFSSIKKPYWIE